MNSGKQLSFQYGEVSPSLRFRSSAVSYSEGLSKLRNMFVLGAGGAGNRPGFIHVFTHPFQEEIPGKGSGPGITGYFIKNPVSGNNDFYEYHKDPSPGTLYNFYKNGADMRFLAAFPPERFNKVDPEKIRFVPLKEDILFTPKMTFAAGNPLLASYPNGLNISARHAEAGVTSYSFGSSTFPVVATLSTPGSTILGTPLLFAVSYILTGVFENEEEIRMGVIETPNPPPGTASTTVWYPNASVSNFLSVSFSVAVPKLKYINVYRAFGGAGQTGKFYKFSQRVLYAGGTSVTVIDFGAEDVSQAAPLDRKLIGGASGLTAADVGAYYQQRLLLGYDKTSVFTPGEIGASKIGAPRELKMPAIFNNTGAFQFSVPVTDSSDVVAILPMERAIALTEKGAYVLRGGEQGVLTPTTVNPVMISTTGCSSRVEPVMKGTKGFYLNRDHTKLMCIEFSIDANLRVFEASTFSDHLITQDIHKMAVIGGKEDIAFLLKKDGTALAITVGDEANGFSTIDTDGFIENIFSFESARPYFPEVGESWPTSLGLPDVDCLFAYVIRDGVRRLEAVIPRGEVFPEEMIFADACSTFGLRKAIKEGEEHVWIPGAIASVFPTITSRILLNISGGTAWAAGETVVLETNSPLSALSDLATTRLNFYYTEDGVEKFIQWIPDGNTATPSDPFFLQAYSGTFSQNIPAGLQDLYVQTGGLNDEYILKASNWIPAYNSFSGLTHLANREVSVFADNKVYSSPNNPEMPTLTVSAGGVLTLPDYVAWGVVGLPYISEMETLDLEASDGRTFTDANKLLNAVGIAFTESRGGYAGIESQGILDMAPINYRTYEGVTVDEENFDGHVTLPIPSQWSEKGRVNIRQVDPLPLTVLAVYPKGMVGN